LLALQDKLPGYAEINRATVTTPVGFAMFPKEISWPPRSWIEHAYTDLRRLEFMPKGGHFAAWEQPELLSNEIIQFFLTDCGLDATFARSIVMKMTPKL
jgi:pimeloyl-ACP methyl ester carboxylesterase